MLSSVCGIRNDVSDICAIWKNMKFRRNEEYEKRAAVLMAALMMLSLAACQKSEAKNVPLNDILEAVKTAYGENYLPQMPYDATALEQQFGLTQDMYEEAVGEAPMMSTHVDTFVQLRQNRDTQKMWKKRLIITRIILLMKPSITL